MTDEDSTIKTEIESDPSYRERLKRFDPNKIIHSIIDVTGGDALDLIGNGYKLYQRYVHTCFPIKEPT